MDAGEEEAGMLVARSDEGPKYAEAQAGAEMQSDALVLEEASVA